MRSHLATALILAGALTTGLAQEAVSGKRSDVAAKTHVQLVLTAGTHPASARNEDGEVRLSPAFTNAALNAAFQLQSTERRVEQSIKRGFPLGEFWIENDLEQVDDSLRLAALNAKNDADLEALRRLEMQTSKLRLWTDWLVEENRNLRLAEYYISSSTLDNDERFQNAVACTSALVSMLSSRRLAESRGCE